MFCWHAEGKTVRSWILFVHLSMTLRLDDYRGVRMCSPMSLMSYEMRDVMGRPYLCCIWVCKQSRHHEPNADNSCFNLIFLMSMQ